MLWIQRRRRRKNKAECADNFKSSEGHKTKKEDWIKSHFSRLSDEKLVTASHAALPTPQLENGDGEAAKIHVETFASRQGGRGRSFCQESVTNRQRTMGSSVIKETSRDSGMSSSADEDTWAAVAACTREIDYKGQQVANSMLQRSKVCQQTGYLESKDSNLEELKALEEVQMKRKGNFLIQREKTMAGMSHSPTLQSRSHHGHQGHLGSLSHQGHSGSQTHQGHLGSQSHQGHSGSQTHQGHLGSQSHQSHPGSQSHQGHPGSQNRQIYSGHQNLQGHPGHQSQHVHVGYQSHQVYPGHQSLQGHPSQQSHNRSHQIYDSFEAA
ncbi:PREDICTED: uncharacterized protein C10orf62 homolog [Elephantulus edwardii]|uniref:uncharacterized protein C10orf62 homolog n=1 Tax=Elephantulus edwardii TaxID=28737 RepID=UPI0003F077E4|nr:PREDICTED: uncharacterized protein C10orf62 homolog [Elephantulus edwardii]